MLYSQGVRLEDLGVPTADGSRDFDPRAAWRILAENYHLFRGTPSRFWLDWVFAEAFGMCTDRFGTPWMVSGPPAAPPS